ncbi:MAG: rRNA maturation RNase YbeY [Parcubacteria group bacterium]|nr:rRNA maturation RNase YbeY [Parcubacteria group bacterium]
MISYGINKNKVLKAVNSVLPKNKTIREFGLVFVSPKKMAEFNLKYRWRKGPTNVLSFVYGDPALERNKFHLAQTISFKGGDVVVCPTVAAEEAKRYGFTQKNWMTRLIVHAILHLAGYDHKTGKDERKMERLEKIVLKKLKVRPI